LPHPSHAVRPIQSVFKPDPHVTPAAKRIGEQHPSGLAVTMLQPQGCQAEAIQSAVDVFNQGDRVGGRTATGSISEIHGSRMAGPSFGQAHQGPSQPGARAAEGMA
jgi:hypothetical protein